MQTAPKDVFLLGSTMMQDSNYLNELFEERWCYLSHACTGEDYSLPPVAGSGPSNSVNQEYNNSALNVQEDGSQDRK
jgi:hypothetical protein